VQVWLRRSAGDHGAEDHGAGDHGAGDHGDAAALAVRAAADLLGVGQAGLAVGHDPAGGPVLAGGPAGAAAVRLSVSRGRGLVAAAVTTAGPVGVDIEVPRRHDELTLARRWFPAREAAWLAGLPARARPEAFLGLWTQKEAIAKALGTGLRGGAGLAQPVRLLADLPRLTGLDPAAWPAEPVLAELVLAEPVAAGPVRGNTVPGNTVLAVAVARIGDPPHTSGAILAIACASPDPAALTFWVRPPGAGE
jgi:4'-phosphopantetheinyl transferase